MHTHFGERPSHVRRFEMVETQSLRRRVEAAIEALIASLDALDGDADLEEAGEDEGCDGGDRESDMAEYGIADRDAMDDPTLSFGCRELAFDGSGAAMAVTMIQRRRVAR